jgi:hypothetical protein
MIKVAIHARAADHPLVSDGRSPFSDIGAKLVVMSENGETCSLKVDTVPT